MDAKEIFERHKAGERDFRGADLHGADLSGATVTAKHLAQARCGGSEPPYCFG